MIKPVKIRKKPVTVEAMQFQGTLTATEIINWAEEYGVTIHFRCGTAENPQPHCHGEAMLHHLAIPTLEGEMLASLDDWIIKGLNDEFYPCKPDIFNKSYEFELTTEPTTPGWYAYSGGAQTMVFYRDTQGKWSVHASNGEVSECDWGYIDQALSVWTLVPIAVNDEKM